MFKKTKVCAGVLVALGGLAAFPGAAMAQETLERIQVTGSSIKRFVDTDSALPISIITAADLRNTGVNTAEGALARITASQSMTGSAQTIGSGTGGAAYANLRGLGANKTLVLLNGRRIAAFAFSSSAVDLNSIPFAAIDRIEVLRDGASAIYGTDAIGGVINFITKKNYTGVDLTVNYSQPQKEGGKKTGYALAGGFGDLDTQGFNVWFAADTQKNDDIKATQREFGRTGVIPEKGLLKTSGTTFPANFSQGSLTGNPSFPACAPPFSLNIPAVSSKNCRFDYTAFIQLVPETEISTGVIKGTAKFGSNYVSLEHMATQNRNLAKIAPDPVTGLTMPPSSPFYPKTFPSLDTSKNITVGWRMIPAGGRTNEANTDANRTVLSLEGSKGNFDYRAGLFHAESKGENSIVSGYLNKSLIQAGITAGKLNPFATADAAGLALIDAAQVRGLSSTAKGQSTGVDMNLATSFGNLAGGPIGASILAEFRKDKYSNNTNDDIVTNVPSLGASPYHVSGERKIWAIGGEMLFPVMKELELSLAGRYDDYSDAGGSFNPKAGFRWTPIKNFNIRGSYNTGFRAPSLDEVYGPQSVTYTGDPYDDPLLCPGGKVTAAGIEPRDCGQQAQILTGGNKNLKPEKSKTFSFGLAFEPVKNLTASIDYWNIKLTDSIGGFPEQAIFQDPAKYASRYNRCKDIPAAKQADLDRCQNEWKDGNGLGYVVGLSDNLGGINTDGIDFAVGYGLKSAFGDWNFNWEATYVRTYDFQRNKGDNFLDNVGKYVDNGPVLKWSHSFGIAWKMGNFSVLASTLYKTGYVDQNNVEPAFLNNVKPYSLSDLSITYSGIKHLKLTGGVRNVFDAKPPFSNQGTVFQQGYEPRLTDPYGRTFFVRVNASY